MTKLIQCKACGESVSNQAASCPKCGQPVPKPWLRYESTPDSTYLLGCIVVIGLVLVFFVCGGGAVLLLDPPLHPPRNRARMIVLRLETSPQGADRTAWR